jgi:hypothetical protein
MTNKWLKNDLSMSHSKTGRSWATSQYTRFFASKIKHTHVNTIKMNGSLLNSHAPLGNVEIVGI